MTFFLGTVLIGITGTAIGAYVQNRSEKKNRVRQKEENELKQAQSLFDKLSPAMDTRLFAMKRIYWGIDSEHIDEKEVQSRWENYQELLLEWNNSLNQQLSMIERYYGSALYKRYEVDIHGVFVELNGLLNGFYFVEEERADFDHKKFNKTADDLTEALRQFNLCMVEALQNWNVGIMRDDLQSAFE